MRSRSLTKPISLGLTCAAFAPPLAAEPTPSRPDTIEVSVEGSRVERTSRREPGTASTVLRGEQLRRAGVSTSHLLRQIPSVELRRSGAALEGATASMRGGTPSQLPVYLGGLRLNDELSGSAELATLEPLLLDRIEVYRGHAPVELGQLGMSGALVLEPLVPRHSLARLHATVGSFGRSSFHALGSLGDRRAGAAFLLARSSARNDFSYLDDQGTRAEPGDDRRVKRENADSSMDSGWFFGRAELGARARLGWFGHVLSRERGVTGLSAIPARHSRETTARTLFGLVARPTHELKLETSFLDARQHLRDPYLELGLGTERLETRSTRAEQRLTTAFQATDWLVTQGHLGWEVDRLLLRPSTGVATTAARYRAEVGGTLRASLSAHAELLVHGRHARAFLNSSSEGDTTTRAENAARLGARLFDAEHVELFANLGYAERPPTLGELFGMSAFALGNRELRAESSVNPELGVRAKETLDWLAVGGQLVGHASFARDLIALRRSSFGQVRPYNVGQARLLGTELELFADFGERLSLESAVSLLDPRDRSPGRTLTNDILPYRSRLSLSQHVELHTRPNDGLPGLRHASLGGWLWHRASRYAVPAGTAVLPAVTTVDLDASVLLSAVPLGLRFAVDDVFDAPVSDALGMPLPGRSYAVSAELTLREAP